MNKNIKFIYALFIITIIASVLTYCLVQQEQNTFYNINIPLQIQTKINQNQNTAFQTITANKALEIVSNLPEIKKWEKLFTNQDGTSPKTGGTPVIVNDSETSTAYVIHVYEDMSDHTSTFGWYYVDKKIGIVTKEDYLK